MQTVTIYEYKISKGQFVQIEHTATVSQNEQAYTIYFPKLRRTVLFTNDTLDIIKDSHLFSLTDDIEAAKQKFIETYEKKIQIAKDTIRKYKKAIKIVEKG